MLRAEAASFVFTEYMKRVTVATRETIAARIYAVVHKILLKAKIVRRGFPSFSYRSTGSRRGVVSIFLGWHTVPWRECSDRF